LRGSIRTGRILNHDDVLKTMFSSFGLEDMFSNGLSDIFKILETHLADKLKDHPETMDKIRSIFKLTDHDRDPMEVDYELSKSGSSYIGEYVQRGLVPRPWQSEFEPAFQTIEVTDPRTGKKKKTYRGAALESRFNIGKQQLQNVVGASLAGGLAYKMIAGPRLVKILLLPPFLYGGYKATKAITDEEPGEFVVPGYDVKAPEFTEWKAERSKDASDYDIFEYYKMSLPILVGNIPQTSYQLKIANVFNGLDFNNNNIFSQIGGIVLNYL